MCLDANANPIGFGEKLKRECGGSPDRLIFIIWLVPYVKNIDASTNPIGFDEKLKRECGVSLVTSGFFLV